MAKIHKIKKTDNTSYIKIFILVVIIAAFVSIVYKGYIVIRDRAFKFSAFNIMLVSNKTQVIGFNRDNKQVYGLEIGDGKSFIEKNTLIASVDSGIPLDGMIIKKTEGDLIGAGDFPSLPLVTSLFFDRGGYDFKNLNQFDLIKLFVIAKITPWTDKNYEKLEGFDYVSERSLKFFDPQVFNEKVSIEILNSTEINGLGARVGHVLSNMGANVISIKEGTDKKTKISAENLSLKTLKRLEELFSLRAEKREGSDVADITINLGKDVKWN